jgi:hypothetical protein
MKTFKEILQEKISRSSRASLYHFTSIFGALGILELNGIGIVEYADRALMKNPKFMKGKVSFTRSKKYRVKGEESVVVFELDQEKISHNYKIKPIADSFVKYTDRPGSYRSEAEEYVDGPIKLKPYLLNIYIDKNSYSELKEDYELFKSRLDKAKEVKNKKIRDLRIKSASNDIKKHERLLFHKKLKVGLP